MKRVKPDLALEIAQRCFRSGSGYVNSAAKASFFTDVFQFIQLREAVLRHLEQLSLDRQPLSGFIEHHWAEETAGDVERVGDSCDNIAQIL